MSEALVDDHGRISDAFGNLQPGLHITLEFTDTNGPYVVGDEPEYTDDAGPTCRSLGRGPRERPIPEYRDGTDGYRDGQPVDERTGKRAGPAPTREDTDDDTYGGSEPGVDDRQDDDGDGYVAQTSQGAATEPPGRAVRASGMPLSSLTYDRMAVGAAVAPALGLAADEVPDIAVLLFAPVARDTQVTVS
jgi:phospholipid/cholesterol/gamma-HCH transport system substrate-binding protein